MKREPLDEVRDAGNGPAADQPDVPSTPKKPPHTLVKRQRCDAVVDSEPGMKPDASISLHNAGTIKTEPSPDDVQVPDPAEVPVPDPVGSVPAQLPDSFEEDAEPPTCKFCQQSPCYLEQGLYEYLEQGAILNDDGDLQETNRQLRYEMYRMATRWIHGPLRRGQRIQLPSTIHQCLC